MTKNKMREAVARAIWSAREMTLPPRTRMAFEDGSAAARTTVLCQADAAIAAVFEQLREPTMVMKDAFHDAQAEHDDGYGGNASAAWKAMLDAALQEASKGELK